MKSRHYKVTLLCGQGYHTNNGTAGDVYHIVPWQRANCHRSAAICGRRPGPQSSGWDEALWRAGCDGPFDGLCRKCRRAVWQQPRHSTVE